MGHLPKTQTQLYSEVNSLNNKFCPNLAYIDAAYQRIHDLNSGIAGKKIIDDLTYIVQTEKIYSGGFGFSSVEYLDKPAEAANWGYIEFFKHADNYVTAKYYQDGNSKVYMGQFILGEGDWKIAWN